MGAMNEPLPRMEEKGTKDAKAKNVVVALLLRVAEFLGFRRHSPYVKDYLNNANIRSGVFMSLVVIVLEVWMVIRRLLDSVIPMAQEGGNFFELLFKNTSNFWLMLFMGVGMLTYCVAYLDKKQTTWKQVTAIIGGVLCLVFAALLPLESFRGNGNIRDILLISFYVSIILFGIAVIGSTIYLRVKGKKSLLPPMAVISFFALVCLVFGVKVSYSDFFSSASYPLGEATMYEHKMIICFLMMTIYVGCLLIWRPFASIGILGVAFLAFYFLLVSFEGVEKTHRKLPDGDVVNYITFFISLTMVCFSIYHQRIQEATKEQKLHELATTDSLTGLYSFDYYLQVVREAIDVHPKILENYQHVFMDLDGFSTYNDQKGFASGNDYLKRFGALLREHFPEGYICRQGEDHFALFVPQGSIESFLSSSKEEMASLDPDLILAINIGHYHQTLPEEDIRRCVDKSRFAAHIGRDTPSKVHEYGRADHDAYHLRQYVIRNVERACEENWVQVYYQPIVDAKSGKVVEFEALARWIDPRRGFLSPASFIPALERARLIHRLDAHVFATVCQDYARFYEATGRSVPISINVSRADFDYMDVAKVLADAREKYGVPAEAIHVEITESALTVDEKKMTDFLTHIHELGYPLWLDDFGSGYSSFNVLKDFRFDVLKIDMRFLEGFGENPKVIDILRSIISMAKSLGMESLCEGVETKEQAAFLRKEGCNKLQGYLFGKASPFEDSLALLDTVKVD